MFMSPTIIFDPHGSPNLLSLTSQFLSQQEETWLSYIPHPFPKIFSSNVRVCWYQIVNVHTHGKQLYPLKSTMRLIFQGYTEVLDSIVCLEILAFLI